MGNAVSTIAEVSKGAARIALNATAFAIESTYRLLKDFVLPPSDHNRTHVEIQSANKAREAKAKAEAETAEEQQKMEQHIEKLKQEKNEAAMAVMVAKEQAKKAASDLKHGIKPVVMPTEQEVSKVYQAVEYNPEKLHFAVCGGSGCGKSSLIVGIHRSTC